MKTRTITALVLCLGGLIPVARAQDQLQPLPRIIPYEGRLELNGRAFTGTRDVTFRLYLDGVECQGAVSPVWSRTKTVNFYAGKFAVQLEDDPATPDPAFDRLMRASEAFLSIEIEDADGNPLPLTGCQVIRPVPYARRSGGDVPIGTVIDWYRPSSGPGATLEVPAGYQICDGGSVTDPRSPLVGSSTPNLVGQFVRGVGSPANIGTSGGNDDLPDYNVTGLDHVHQWSYFTGGSSRDWMSYNSSGVQIMVMNWNDGMDSPGSGNYPLSAPNTTSLNLYTAHPVPGWTPTATPAGSATGRNLPRYVGLLKLIRIY